MQATTVFGRIYTSKAVEFQILHRPELLSFFIGILIFCIFFIWRECLGIEM